MHDTEYSDKKDHYCMHARVLLNMMWPQASCPLPAAMWHCFSTFPAESSAAKSSECLERAATNAMGERVILQSSAAHRCMASVLLKREPYGTVAPLKDEQANYITAGG
jgi:hypothetical protein